MNQQIVIVLACAAVVPCATGTSNESPAPPTDGIIVEAEQFALRDPDDGSFAVASREPYASGAQVLSRFFPKNGRCVYRFSVPRDGTYQIWLRYAANRAQRIRLSVNANENQPTAAALPGTGKLSGPDAWKWSRLTTAQLRSGPNQLTVHGCPIRLDCFWLSTDAEPPRIDQLMEMRLQHTHEYLRDPIEPITPAWLAEAAEYTLPEWYERTRVCAHTRLSWRWKTRNPEVFFGAGRRFASLGLHEFVRHIKSGGEGAWWPSQVGPALPEARDANFAKQIIDEAHRAGCRILVYYRHMEDAFIAQQHPEWAARDHAGKIIEKRGPKICFNTPYADYVQTRLVELAKMGADGFYFDEVHMPKPFCWCANCRQRFTAATGLEYPRTPDPFDPAYQKAIDFKNVTIERVFRKWRQAIHHINAEAVLVVGSNTYPQMVERHTTQRLYRIADAMKTEFSLPARAAANRVFALDTNIVPTETDARLALGYALARDACDGRPPHVWIHGLPNTIHAQFAAAGVIAHGGVANLDHPENTIPDPTVFKEAIELGNRMAPALAGARPLRWAAVHYSEYARDHYLPDEPRAWRQVLYPVYGAFTTLLRAHLPVGIVTDSQLEQGHLQGCRVLFVASQQHLTTPMKKAIEQFRQDGGRVVYQRSDWRWHEPHGGMRRAGDAFLDQIGDAIKSVPVTVLGGTPKMHSVVYTNPKKHRITIALVNDFSWVFTGRTRTRDGRPIANLDAKLHHPPPPDCKNVVVIIRTDQTLQRVREVVADEPLKAIPHRDGYRIDVPAFACTAVVTVDLK